MRKREAREMEAKALCPATPTKVVKASAVVLANPMARPSPMRECTRMAQRMAMLPVFIAARSMKSFMRACSFCASTSADAAGPREGGADGRDVAIHVLVLENDAGRKQ